MERVQASSSANDTECTMSANTVLLWMSARQEGSWQQYRAAFERLYAEEGEDDDAGAGEDNGLAPHQELRFNLTRLGHVEDYPTTDLRAPG